MRVREAFIYVQPFMCGVNFYVFALQIEMNDELLVRIDKIIDSVEFSALTESRCGFVGRSLEDAEHLVCEDLLWVVIAGAVAVTVVGAVTGTVAGAVASADRSKTPSTSCARTCCCGICLKSFLFALFDCL